MAEDLKVQTNQTFKWNILGTVAHWKQQTNAFF